MMGPRRISLNTWVFFATLAGAQAIYECCAGGDNGCAGHLQIGDGDCDSDNDCAGDLLCGTDNCGLMEGFNRASWPVESSCGWVSVPRARERKIASHPSSFQRARAAASERRAPLPLAPSDRAPPPASSQDTTDDCCCRATAGGGCTTVAEDHSANECLYEDTCPYRCCAGNDAGCEGKLQIGDGDCDRDSDCADGLKCGTDNCGLDDPGRQAWPVESECGWDTTDDCCARDDGHGGLTTVPLDNEPNECLEVDACEYVCCGGDDGGCHDALEWLHIGDGDCDSDDDCAGDLVCGTDNCGRQEGFDISHWPVESQCGWDTTDDCCCRPTDDGGCTTIPEDQSLTTKCLAEDGCGARVHGGGAAASGGVDAFSFAMGMLTLGATVALALVLLYLARHPSEARRCSQLPSDLCELLGFGAPKAYAPVSRPGGGSSVQLTGVSDGGNSEYVAPAWEAES